MLVALLALLASADDFMERVNPPVALTVPGMDRVHVLADRPHDPRDKAHRFDVPRPPEEPAPSERPQGRCGHRLLARRTAPLNHPEAPHGFDHDADPRTREVLLAFLAFLGTHLSPGAAPG